MEGDNFHALRSLRAAFKGRFKCIYIDPPYNTGNRDFVYNDAYLDKDDAFRHSTWLEFLYRRLSLVRDLLREDGVLLVSINDENRAYLELLLEQVWPCGRVGSFVWRKLRLAKRTILFPATASISPSQAIVRLEFSRFRGQ